MLKNKNILITGGAGFIGSNLFERLIEEDNFIIIIDNFNDYYSGKEKRFNQLTESLQINKDFDLIKGNLINKNIFKNIEIEIDVIFHLAAQAGVRYSIENALEVSNNNIISTVNVLEYAINHSVGKVVNASSSSVYGNPIYTPVNEEHPKNPISPYAVSKLCGEQYVDYYSREYELPCSSLRFYTVYGPRGRPDMAIRKFINLILDGKEIKIYGDGKQIRDFTYVSDIVDGLILAAENKKAYGEIFNLGCSDPISVNKLVDKIYKIIDSERNIQYVETKKGDVDATYSDITKAQEMLNFKPKIHIDEGLKRTYNWQLKRRESK
ncbi:MAG: NAD-dependent epimerase/dehydratase family protein [Candidatus Lokiarchaeota archaeon]|nr:NAD-dependent epimerase/dehydratase family protein [Candidatus Lokiarchaeota archaeon]